MQETPQFLHSIKIRIDDKEGTHMQRILFLHLSLTVCLISHFKHVNFFSEQQKQNNRVTLPAGHTKWNYL